MDVTLEKVDQVIERTGVTYGEAKKALEVCQGDVLEAIIYLENMNKIENEFQQDAKSETIEEFKTWLKELIKKGNVTRIKVSKDEKVLVDVPVNAGIAAGVIAVIVPSVLAFGVIAAVATKVTIEITKEDGSVEVINKYISKAVHEVKDKATDIAGKVRDKVSEVNFDGIKKNNETKDDNESETTFTYTVNFDEEDK